MSATATTMDDRLRAYLGRVGWREHPALRDLREITDDQELGDARSSVEQAALLAFMVETIGARRVLEIGGFTGHAALAMALALPEDGRVVMLEADPRWPELGRPFWERSGAASRIELRLGLARDTLEELIAEGAEGSFDLAYVDADKKTYALYVEKALQLIRPGGILALDNVLWRGAVADPGDSSRQVGALRLVTARLHADPALAMVTVPIGDGLLLCRKRG